MKTLFKLRVFGFSIFLIFAMIMATVPNASALTVTRNFISSGNALPGLGINAGAAPTTNVAGGGSLQTIFNFAADIWEAAILDTFTVTLNYGWSPLASIGSHRLVNQGGTPNRETTGTIRFDNDGSTAWFIDSTPEGNDEYATFTSSSADLGGGVVNTGRVFSDPTGNAVNRSDILSTAVHEIGHALGLSSRNTSYQAESWPDNDIDVTAATSALFAGTVIFTNNTGTTPPGGAGFSSNAHLTSANTLMRPFRPLGIRRQASAVDILANAQISGFTNLNLNPYAPVPEPATMLLLGIGLAGLAGVGARRKWKKKALEKS